MTVEGRVTLDVIVGQGDHGEHGQLMRTVGPVACRLSAQIAEVCPTPAVHVVAAPRPFHQREAARACLGLARGPVRKALGLVAWSTHQPEELCHPRMAAAVEQRFPLLLRRVLAQLCVGEAHRALCIGA